MSDKPALLMHVYLDEQGQMVCSAVIHTTDLGRGDITELLIKAVTAFAVEDW